MLHIDGSTGEGGGQIVRSSLGLSLLTGTPFRISNIRGRRKRPGLLRQHLTAVQAATEIGKAKVGGARLGSSELVFEPTTIAGGEYSFAIGTAGSATLVLQAVLPALLQADGPSLLTIEGGTHNPMAPSFDFLERCFFPILRRMGVSIEAQLVRPGFYPAGGGQFIVKVTPCEQLDPIELLERGELRWRRARAVITNLPVDIAKRELAQLQKVLEWESGCFEVVEVDDSLGPGNLVSLELEYESVSEMLTSFGEKNRSAKAVVDQAIEEYREYISVDAPVGKHLTDQLLIPMAMAGSGSFRCLAPTGHTLTNVDVIQRFLPVQLDLEREGGRTFRVTASPTG
jgi:RNA 3'-terminal phosphate cyclase (ATP)